MASVSILVLFLIYCCPPGRWGQFPRQVAVGPKESQSWCCPDAVWAWVPRRPGAGDAYWWVIWVLTSQAMWLGWSWGWCLPAVVWGWGPGDFGTGYPLTGGQSSVLGTLSVWHRYPGVGISASWLVRAGLRGFCQWCLPTGG